MTLTCRRIAALLTLCAFLLAVLMPAAVRADEGEQIYAKALKERISEISVVRYGENGSDIVDTWSESILGKKTGEWLYCTEPETKFEEGYKTAVPAEKHMSENAVRLIGAMMYWFDENMCAGTDSTDEYMFRQEIVWNILNQEKKWRPECRYEHGRGEKCGFGHSLESHREKLFSDGLEWAEKHSGQVEVEAVVYEGKGQPLMDLTYKWKPRGFVKIHKMSAEPELTDGNGCYSLDGAVYGIYADKNCSRRISTLTTDGGGDSNALELDVGQYYIKEDKAPSGYALDPAVYPVTVTEDRTAALDVRDIPQSAPAEILLQKLDAETGKNVPQGAAALAGGEFTVHYYAGLYEGGVPEQPDRTWVIRTDDEGRGMLSDESLVSGDSLFRNSQGEAVLPLGTITIQETKAPEGYLINEEVFVIPVTSDGNAEKVCVYNMPEVPERVIRGELRIIKTAQDADEGKEHKRPLEGVVFEITSKTTGKSVRITTDENGYAGTEQIGNLPYDTYIVSETVTPDGYEPVGDFEVTVSEEGQVLHYILEDKLVVAPVRLVKTDASTGKTIPVAGAEYQLLDSGKKPVSMTTYYPKEETHQTFITDETGSFVLPEKLLAGVYYFREVKAPDGYLLNGNDIRFEISDSADWTEPVVITAEDSPAMGRIRVEKTDEYTDCPLQGARFSVTAAEDIVTPDGTVRAAKGTKVAVLSTGEDGIAESEPLYLGKYILKEEKQPSGYVLPENAEWTVELKYRNQDTAVTTQTEKVGNRPTVVIIDKRVSGSEQRLPGVEFVIWNADREDSADSGMTRSCTTDRNGQIRLEALPPGRYCVQEVQGVPGYAVDSGIHEFEIGEDGCIEGQGEYTLTVENKKTRITETNAVCVDTDTSETYPWKKTAVRDTVSITNIQPGEEYRLTGILMDSATGSALREDGSEDGDFLKCECLFTGTEPEMTVDMMFEFDASAFAGRTVVVYEYLYQSGVRISEHTDPEDERQQFRIKAPEMGTTAASPESGTHDIPAGENAAIRDVVKYKEIIPGIYTLKGILMDRDTGEPLLINGERITAEKEFEITEADGITELEFSLDASGLDGRQAVVFEYLYRKGCGEPAASHEDITDQGQTVTFRGENVPHTGDTAPDILSIISAAAGAAGLAVLLAARGTGRILKRKDAYNMKKKMRTDTHGE